MDVHIFFGPTGSGKSAKAHKLWEQAHYPILSVDSRKLYKKLDIGTNKLETLEFIKQNHTAIVGGIDILEITEECNAFKFREYAYNWLEKNEDLIRTYGGLIIHGGTGLYLDALFDARSLQTPKNSKLRAELATYSLIELQKMASKKSRKEYEKLNHSDQNNPRRLARIIEISTVGKKQEENVKIPQILIDMQLIYYEFEIDRETLYNKINERVELYLRQGWLAEIHYLLQKYSKDSPGLNVMGYREIIQFMIENTDWEIQAKNRSEKFNSVIEHIKQMHRNYAKRQITWKNHQVKSSQTNLAHHN